MHYHIILTEKCNLQCRYCYEKSMHEFDNGLEKRFKFDFSAPCDLNIVLEKLKKFLEKDSNPVLIFYGGEPLLQKNKIIEIMDYLKDLNLKYRMQTNGQLLNLLPKEYLNKITKILISLDGDKERTDFNRGKGTYDKIMQNISLMKKNGYNGELIARMTIAQDFPDIYEQVLNLISAGFDSIHWQLDIGFYKEDFNKEKITNFINKINESTSKLIKYWVEKMEEGKVLKFYPFLGIIESLLKEEKTLIRCGAGHSGYAITTNGKISACPIMNNIEDFVCGTIENSPNKLKKILVDECNLCEIKDICGGRCIYWRKAKLWPKTGDKLICKSIKYLISELQGALPEIKKLIDKKIISQKDFDYEKYFGPEIIP
ncbi:MAG TPA: TIGR04084 family radical SAM/SPASM domain-containing protein [Candidatus Nanoarchaeia archaeon]|nr:TIGR04084 family radical SAM/SPASM domain-containing protein [Candidatus Nanoarchaeia archaeon]